MDESQFLLFINNLCEEINKEHERIKKISNSKELLTELKELFKKKDRHLFLIRTFFLQHALEKKGISFEKWQRYYFQNINSSELYRLLTKTEHQIHLDERKRDLSNCLICLGEWEKELNDGKQKDNKKNPQKESGNKQYFCYGCGKTKTGNHLLNKEDEREFCSQECFLDYYAELCFWCVKKCLKYERGIPTEFQAYYLDGDRNSGDFLCSGCNQKQKKDLEEKLDKILREQEQGYCQIDEYKRKMKHNEKFIEKNNFVIDISSNYNNKERERERERESKINAFIQKLLGWISELEEKDNLDELDEELLAEMKRWLEEIEDLSDKEKRLEEENKESEREIIFWSCLAVIFFAVLVIWIIYITRNSKGARSG